MVVCPKGREKLKSEKEIKAKIRIISQSLEEYSGRDEYTASRTGKLKTLEWIIGKEKDLTLLTWDA